MTDGESMNSESDNMRIFQKDEIETVIGDEKQPSFYPRMKIKRWGNEANFSVGVISDKPGGYTDVEDKIEWVAEDGIKARFYEKNDNDLEFEIELPFKPQSNTIELSIRTKGLNFFYQPELTQDEIDNGCIRPNEVIGSYAVYHNSRRGDYSKAGGANYRTGKAFHIYRPEAIDAYGMRVWCNMHIDVKQNIMTITVPQEFLNCAQYPVIIDPTFGCSPSSPGGSWYTGAANDLMGSLFTSPSDADTADDIRMYMKEAPMMGAPSAYDVKGVIVLHSNLNILTNGIGGATTVPASETGAWFTSTFATAPALSASTGYVLMLIHNALGMLNAHVAYDTGSADQGHIDYTNDYTTPINPTDAAHSTHKFSIYCTYSAAAGTAIPVFMHHYKNMREN